MRKTWVLLVCAACLLMMLFVACSNDENSTLSDDQTDGTLSDMIDDIKEFADDVLDDTDKAEEDLKDELQDGTDDLTDDLTDGTEDDLTQSTPSSDMETSESGASVNDASLFALATASVNVEDFESLDQTLHGWGQGTIVDDSNVPVGCLDYQEQFGQYDADFVQSGSGTIYLTFDEGYENGYTAEILDVLQEKDCPAVFFVTMDYAESESDLVTRMLDEGHQVGNHTTTHPSMATISVTEQIEEIATLHDYVVDNFGYEMTLFRPPMGEFSTQSLAVTQYLGYRSVFWSFAYVDWDVDAQPDSVTALQTMTDSLHDGAIYLLHAVSATNAKVLGDFIDQARAMGYEFASYPV